MISSSILNNIKDNLSLNYYNLDNLVFYVNENQSSSITMKALIEITNALDKNKVEYRIDHLYNIHIINE